MPVKPLRRSAGAFRLLAAWALLAPGATALGCHPVASDGVSSHSEWVAALEAAPRPVPVRPSKRQPPIRVHVSGPDSPGADAVEVEAKVTAPKARSLRIALRLPPGVRLLEGRAMEIVDRPPPTLSRSFRVLAGARSPRGDLEVVVETLGPGPQATGRDAYRFGRAPAKLPRPPRRPGALIVQGHSLGEPIPLR